MADLEKVIKRLEKVSYYFKSLLAVGWQGDADIYREHMESVNMSITMLKEQEAVEPYQHDAVWLCGNCEKEVVGWDDDIDGKEYRYPFCRQCGKPVKWE